MPSDHYNCAVGSYTHSIPLPAARAGEALTNVLGRPGCAVLPLTLKTGMATLSFGCKGNRTFTGLSDSEMYVAIPGDKWAAVAEKLVETNAANASMGTFYQGRKAEFAAAG